MRSSLPLSRCHTTHRSAAVAHPTCRCCTLQPAAAAHPNLQVGFRHAQIKGRQLLHNNQPIMIKGGNKLPCGYACVHLCVTSCLGSQPVVGICEAADGVHIAWHAAVPVTLQA